MLIKEYEVGKDEVLEHFDKDLDIGEVYAYGCYEKPSYRYILGLIFIVPMLLFMTLLFIGFFSTIVGEDNYAAAFTVIYAVLYVIALIYVIRVFVLKLKKEFSKKYFIFTDMLIGIASGDAKPDYYALHQISSMHFKRGNTSDLLKIDYSYVNVNDIDSRIVVFGFHNADELCEVYSGKCGARVYLDGKRV